jgi:hypothetical protein
VTDANATSSDAAVANAQTDAEFLHLLALVFVPLIKTVPQGHYTVTKTGTYKGKREYFRDCEYFEWTGCWGQWWYKNIEKADYTTNK